ncbi:MAG: sensor histidine kinase [Actinomycetota bacterium]
MSGPPTRTMARWSGFDAFRRRPWLGDGLLALALVFATVLAVATGSELDTSFEREIDAGYWLLVLAMAAPVIVRRTVPTTAMVIAGAATTTVVWMDYAEPPATAGLVILLYSCAVYARRDRAVASLVVTAMVVLVIAVAVSNEVNGIFVAVLNYLIFGIAWFLGDSIRYRRAYQAELEERARRLEAEQDERARLAVVEERRRLTRELHDVVAHGVSVMVVQAGAARRALGDERPQVSASLESIETTGRGAMRELRRVLAVLRSGDESEELTPQPGLVQLEALVEQCRTAGVDVELDIDPLPPLSPGRELSVYRVVQEALTNVMKHAGPASVRIGLRTETDALVVEIVDDGRGGAADESSGPGFGLLGLEERVSMFDGQLRHGPRVGGGWQVRATFPVPQRAAS